MAFFLAPGGRGRCAMNGPRGGVFREREFTRGGRRNPQFIRVEVVSRPGEPGAVAVVVDYLRAAGDMVLPLGRGRFRINSRYLCLDKMIHFANRRRSRHGLAPLMVGAADWAICHAESESPVAAELAGGAAFVKLPQPWTPGDDGMLSAAWRAGQPMKLIAAALGRTEGAVYQRRRALGLAPRDRRP